MKVYEKPRVYIERFELSQHIAACAWDMTTRAVRQRAKQQQIQNGIILQVSLCSQKHLAAM